MPADCGKVGSPLNYVIAAYGLVVGTLVWYAWRVQSQRRRLKQQLSSSASDEADA